MKILVITQKVDRNDPVLGFFHRWLEEFAKNFGQVLVICLEKGEYNLPKNVKVLSLGKEKGNSKFGYIFNFYKYIWDSRRAYDAVFVHMNQEYVLLGAKHWFLMRKPVYLWRNHAKGSLWTRLAVLLSRKVFYTSPQSFTAQFGKSVQMPVGIDTDFFKPDPTVVRIPNSVLFLGRISPVKKVLEFIEWLGTTDYTATIAGPILPQDREYGERVKLKIENSKLKINFVGPVDQAGALRLYQTHEIYVNMTPAGSFDKTILEAAACGMKLRVDNPDAQDINVEEHGLGRLAERLTEEMK